MIAEISQPLLLSITFLYVLGLAAVALWAERRTLQPRWHPYIYSFTLAVYCSSWTYFGAVGTAAIRSWHYVPIYAGPLLLFLFGQPLIRKLAQAGSYHKTTSIADFIGTRYGKRQLLAAVVTIVAVVGSMPYIALQLKAVSQAWITLTEPAALSLENSRIDPALATALFLAGFAMLFGTRHLESRERNYGLMAALAVESIVKLIALLLIAALGVWMILQAEDTVALSGMAASWLELPLEQNMITALVLSVLAIICLPRQFHVTVVEFQGKRDLHTARWLFPLYLLLIIALVIPITLAGQYQYQGTGIEPDTYVLRLPLDGGWGTLTLLAFIGGFSAATGMAIVATVTLAIMLSNEMVLPALLRWKLGRFSQTLFLGQSIRWVRRSCILLLLLAAWLINRSMVQFEGLASMGLVSFACFAQLSPALLGAIYWKKAHANGVYAGLTVGFAGWFYCLLLPSFYSQDSSLLVNGPWSIGWLRPEALFGLRFLEPLTQGVVWSLLPNWLVFVLVSLVSKPSFKDSGQAEAFVDSVTKQENFELSPLLVKQLRKLLDAFVGPQPALWRAAERKYRQRLLDDDRAPMFVVADVETALSSVIGAASAQRAVALLERHDPPEFKDIAEIVGGASKQLQFSQDLLQVTIETISQGISVVDAELRLVAWNRRYEEIFEYPSRLLYVGCPIERVYTYNAQKGMYRDGDDIAEQVAKRLELLKSGGPHRFERTLPNGATIQVIGNPMGSGGFVTTYTDVSDYKAVVRELEEAKTTLEERVRQRTADLEKENQLRSQAEQEIRAMHQSKSKFMQAASHDLLQPINAAKLFAATLLQTKNFPEPFQGSVKNITHSLETAEQLISALREMARLESGKLAPQMTDFSLQTLLQPLTAEFAVLARQKGLQFRGVVSRLMITSDAQLLRRIVQNFLSNAVHYTRRGKILLGVRRRVGAVAIEVWDTGPGISPAAVGKIFDEFERLNTSAASIDKGLGLGLTIARRMADLLGAVIEVDSTPGRGAVFRVVLPLKNQPSVPGEAY